MSLLVSEGPRTLTRRSHLWSLAALLAIVGAGAGLLPTISANPHGDLVGPIGNSESKTRKSCCDSVCPLCDTEAKAKTSCCDSVCPLCDTEVKATKSCCSSKTAATTASRSDE